MPMAPKNEIVPEMPEAEGGEPKILEKEVKTPKERASSLETEVQVGDVRAMVEPVVPLSHLSQESPKAEGQPGYANPLEHADAPYSDGPDDNAKRERVRLEIERKERERNAA